MQVADQPSQSFAALFELSGSAEAGDLLLSTPIGTAIAQLRWTPGSATLQTSGQTRAFASVDELVRQATGTAVPVTALFDWLAGRTADVPGWQPDLSQVAAGRLRATRSQPEPMVELLVALDR